MFSQSHPKFPLRNLFLAHPAVSQRVDERQAFIKERIVKRGKRNRLIERFECDAFRLTFGVLHGRQVVPGFNELIQRRRRVSRQNPARRLSPICGENIFDAMKQEFFECRNVGSIAQFRRVQQMGRLTPFHRRMDFGS